MQPTVSIILPNYNYARYLRQRFDSLLQQSYQDFEIILLDDCSTDGSQTMLAELAGHPKVSRLEINQQNSGSPFIQWAKGIALARGKYIWIAEADDLAAPLFLERCVTYLERYPQAGIAFTASQIIDELGNPQSMDYDCWSKRPYLQGRQATLYNGRKFAGRNMYWRNCIYNASGVVFRKDVLTDKAVAVLSAMRYCADWQFWSERMRYFDVIEIHERLNHFRVHTGSVTRLADYAGTIEAFDVLHIFHVTFEFPVVKRMVRCGMFYKRINRLQLTAEQRKDLRCRLQAVFGYGSWVRYMADLAKVCPSLPTEWRNNTHGTAV